MPVKGTIYRNHRSASWIRMMFAPVILSLLVSSSFGQWLKKATNIFGAPVAASGGMIYVKNGVIWAGYKKVVYSLDTGKTWTTSLPSLNLVTDVVQTIDFVDAMNGLVRTSSNIYYTQNGGATWSMTGVPGINGRYTVYNGSVNNVISPARDGIYISNNGGASWIRTFIGLSPSIASYRSNGTVAVFDGNRLVLSTDFGQTWLPKPINFSLSDSYSMGWDYCDSNRLYVANEDYFVHNENRSEVMTTSDRGTTWYSAIQRPLNVFNGAMSTSRDAIFFQTLSNGVFRSTNQGATWDSIGGPNNAADTRWIYAITSDIVVGIDPNGDVWRTDNSGGYPITIPPPVFIPPQPITITACERDSTEVIIDGLSCHYYTITKASLSGPNSANFTLGSSTTLPHNLTSGKRDSFTILFDPQHQSGLFLDTIHITWNVFGSGISHDTTFVVGVNVSPVPPKCIATPPLANFAPISPCLKGRDTVVTLSNVGCDTLKIMGMNALPNGFTIDPLLFPITIPPDSSVRVVYHFSPKAPGTYFAASNFLAEWRGIQQVVTVQLNGKGTSTGYQLSQLDSLLNIGTVSSCSPRSDTSITIKNFACDTLRITSGPGALGVGFSADPLALPILIPPDSSITIRFHFRPPTVGAYSTPVSFTGDWHGFPAPILNFLLFGTSSKSIAGPTIPDSVVNFGAVSVCDPFKDSVVTFKNRGCDTLRITSGPGSISSEFTVDGLTYPIILPPDSSITITLHFHPKGIGSYQSSAKFTMTRQGTLQNLSLSLRGKSSPGVAGPTVLNATYTFDTVTSCNPRRDTSLRLTNRGCDTLTIVSGPGILGNGFTADLLPLPILLPPDSSVTAYFHFAFPGLGSAVAFPHFETERQGQKGSVDFMLQSFGTPGASTLSVATPVINFSPVSICKEDSAEIIYTNLGCDTLFVTPQGLTGDQDFVAPAGNETALLPGDTIRIRVKFSPLQKGNHSCTYKLHTRSRFGDEKDTTILITGIVNSGTKLLTQSLTSIDFHSTRLCASPDSSITFSNFGCDTLTIDNATLSAGGFSLTGVSFPIVIVPGGSATLPIATTLDTIGGKPNSSATLSISSGSDVPITPITLSRGYIYPKLYPLRFEGPSKKYTAGDTMILRIMADDLPYDLTEIKARFAIAKPDMLAHLFTKSVNTVSIVGETITITGNPVVSDDSVLAELHYEVFLSKDSVSDISFSDVHFNSSVTDYERCIASSSTTGDNALHYNFLCGDRTIMGYLNNDLVAQLHSIRPNPAKDEITLDLNTASEEDIDVIVSDVKGSPLLRKSVHHAKDRNAVTFDISSLPSGKYFMQLEVRSSHLTTTFIKEK